MRTLNLGIVAHVDAGKTSLTERLLYAAGAIDEPGSVDAGTTRADTMVLERQRGITIKAAVVSFVVGDVTVNVIDTPGHPDFVAEVERVLSVLDGAVLVVSAVESVQPQTRVLSRALQRLRVPTLVFVNKLDRAGADDSHVLRDLVDRLTLAPVALTAATDIGTREASVTPYGKHDPELRARLLDLLSANDDGLLADYVDQPAAVTYDRLRAELANQTRRALVQPVMAGSAITGTGVDALMHALVEFLPVQGDDAASPVSGTVFKVDRGPAGERIAFVRMRTGTLHARDRVRIGRFGASEREQRRVTAISVFAPGGEVASPSVSAGRIAKVWGLGDVTVGDTVGTPSPTREAFRFAPPSLETIVTPRNPADRTTMYAALTQLAEQDPLIGLRPDRDGRETALSLYGEVQKEVIGDTLAADFGVAVEFRESTTICIERPAGTGSAVVPIPPGRSPEHPLLAGLGLRIEPQPVDSGVQVALEIERGSLPRAFRTAVEESVPEGLRQGLAGWEVSDCRVIVTHSEYWARQSHMHGSFDRSRSTTADDFRCLSLLVVQAALKRAGTIVCEPMHRFHLELPVDLVGLLLSALAGFGAEPQRPEARGASYLIEGDIPAAQVHALQQQLPTLTRGEGVLESAFDHYRPVLGTVSTRPRRSLG